MGGGINLSDTEWMEWRYDSSYAQSGETNYFYSAIPCKGYSKVEFKAANTTSGDFKVYNGYELSTATLIKNVSNLGTTVQEADISGCDYIILGRIEGYRGTAARGTYRLLV